MIDPWTNLLFKTKQTSNYYIIDSRKSKHEINHEKKVKLKKDDFIWHIIMNIKKNCELNLGHLSTLAHLSSSIKYLYILIFFITTIIIDSMKIQFNQCIFFARGLFFFIYFSLNFPKHHHIITEIITKTY